MIIRKLSPEENGRTRALYEEVFSEDKGPFSEYYYASKARENEIYTAEEDDEICSMLHLNPVRCMVFGQERDLSYIVAVSTKERCRHRGMMRRLLERSLQDTAGRGEPFVFLMPANEAIYTPFGFRTSWPWQWEDRVISGKLIHNEEYSDLETDDEKTLTAPEAELLTDEKLELLSRRVNYILAGKFDIYAIRSVRYYRNLGEEQRASGSTLRIKEAGLQPLHAYPDVREAFPDMMARVADVKAFFELVHASQVRTEYWRITDPIIPDNNGCFRIEFDPQGSRVVNVDAVPADRLVRSVSVEEIPAALGEENPFSRVFLSEVV